MALTRELISAQTALSSLTDEQLDAIVTLSANDENTVIGNRLGEIYRDMDDRITAAFGIQRGGNEKTRDFLSRAAQEYTGKFADYDSIKSSVSTLTAENAKLLQQIKDGTGDKELKVKNDQLTAELASAKQAFTDLQNKFDTAANEHKAALLGLEVDNELKSAMAGIKLKQNLPESAVKALTEAALRSVKAKNPDFVATADGKRQLVFRDANGGVLNNAQNQLNPFTAAELLSNELKALGVLDEGRHQPGGGTNTPPATPPSVDVSQARSRVEADRLISENLMKQGFKRNTPEFQSKMLEMRQELASFYNNLPMQ